MAYIASKPALPNFVFSLEHLPYEGLNLIEIIEQEHRFIEGLFERYKQSKDLLEKQELAFHTIRALICHSICEETAFYPTLRWKLPDGNKEADSLIAEHLHMRETLGRLDAMEPSDPEFDLEYQRVVLETIAHTRGHEEKTVLPRFCKFFSDEQLLDMAGHWRECLQSVHHHHREQQARKEASAANQSKSQAMKKSSSQAARSSGQSSEHIDLEPAVPMSEPLKSMPSAHVDKNEHMSHHINQGSKDEPKADLSNLEHAIPMEEPLKSMPSAHVDKNEHMHQRGPGFEAGNKESINQSSKKSINQSHDKDQAFGTEPRTSKQKTSNKQPHVINIE